MKLQNYLLKIAAKPQMVWAVFLLTVCESIFLFVPTEVFMAPPILADKRHAFRTVVTASLGSLAGGAISYLIGMYLFDSAGEWLIETFSSYEKFEFARQLFFKHGISIVLLAAFSPVPYKLMTLTAGFLGYDPVLFLGLCAVFRTGRFAAAGFLLWRFQERANIVARKYFWPLAAAAIAAAIIGIFIIGMI
jgi:membrane protein YqaA with SNARE-associated domain